jgi:Domain of unknown function (DUF1836).
MYNIKEVKMMDKNEIYKILDEVDSLSHLHPNDIPSLDLYIDQIMTLFDIHLADNKRHSHDKLLTKTMINNYSKEGLIKPIKGKKYSKDHILQMILIYSLKNTISIQEIKKVIQPYHEQTEKIEPLYTQFLEIENEFTHQIKETSQQFIEQHNIQLDDRDQLTIALLIMCSLSNQYKMIAEKILDKYYLND